MQDTIQNLLWARGIELCAPLSLRDCRITRPYLLERARIRDGTAFLFAVPYYTTECENSARNISAYAVSADYHRFFAALFEEILPLLQAKFPAHRFAGFADHSPIAETDAAARAGLGCIGCNRLLLTEKYSSYVFLGEIVTDAFIAAPAHEAVACSVCDACKRTCPVELCAERCLSALTQKKGELDTEERASLLAHKIAWGCDRCQECCPVTVRAKRAGTLYTSIPFFKETALPHVSAASIREMDDETFAARAYSWRGRSMILRNLELLEKGERE